MVIPFPSPTVPVPSRNELFLRYLDFFRDTLVDKVTRLPEAELRTSRLPSAWTPLELLKHVTFVELRWLDWGFAGREVAEPWGDNEGTRWHVAPDETLTDLLIALRHQAGRTREIVEAHELTDLGVPGPRWEGADPPALERVLCHLFQEYARHVGHLDIVAELADAEIVGE
ncbi:MAG TPA: DUF664 domain-containing protein [Pseudonocardiaceae bacterium]|jgi:uncharacterized damage-inducible protein DinB|nr:DUF664 domain-containing protein [Pseudonocardiaceae bacterium]